MELLADLMRGLWIGGVAATPLALAIGAICRVKGLSAATRHLLWATVLVSFVTPAAGMLIWRPDWFRTERILAVADSALTRMGSVVEPEAAPSAELAAKPVKVEEQPRTNLVGSLLLPSITAALPESTWKENQTGVVGGMGGVGSQPRTGSVRSASGLPRDNMSMPIVSRDDRPAMARINPRAAAEPVLEKKTAPVEAKVAEVKPSALRRVTETATGLRDVVASNPPIPAWLWLGVAALLVAMSLWRTIRARRILHGAEEADVKVRHMVLQEAERIGLARAPAAYFVDRPVSPMIWCGLKPRLILPRGLWEALDESSQRAVLVHELAHVRRMDHVMCWVDLLIGAIYWWHPLTWWARRKLHDEAEASCDAWVIRALPESRRAYATALLATKSFVSMEGRVSGPWGVGGGRSIAGGVGVLSGSAKKMARRITMVMTQKAAPKKSMVGGCVALAVLGLGTFVMPGLACPPEQAAKTEGSANPNVIVVTPGLPTKAKISKNKAQGLGASTSVSTGPSASGQANFYGEAPALEAMKARKGGPVMVMPPMPPAAAMAPVAPVAPNAPGQVMMLRTPKASGGQCGASRNKSMAMATDLKAGKIAKVYVLPRGKSQAFWELMSRSDVPVFVENRGNAIVVYATEAQHPTIEAFIKIISPGVQGQGARDQSGGAGRSSSAARADLERLAEFRAAQAGQIRSYQQAMRDLERGRAQIEREAERMREQADRSREQQERMGEAAERLRDHAAELEEEAARKSVQDAADKMQQKADAMSQHSDELQQKADELQSKVDELQSKADELQSKVDDMEQKADELEERISQAEEQMEDEEDLAEIDEEAMEITPGAIVTEGEEIGAPDAPMAPMDEESDDDEDDAPAASPFAVPAAPAPVAVPAPAASPALIPTPAPAVAPLSVPEAPAAPTPQPAKAPSTVTPSIASTRHA